MITAPPAVGTAIPSRSYGEPSGSSREAGDDGASFDQLRAAALELGVPSRAYRVGAGAEGAWTLLRERSGWVVFRSEQGMRRELVSFSSARQATAYLIGQLYLGREHAAGLAEPMDDLDRRGTASRDSEPTVREERLELTPDLAASRAEPAAVDSAPTPQDGATADVSRQAPPKPTGAGPTGVEPPAAETTGPEIAGLLGGPQPTGAEAPTTQTVGAEARGAAPDTTPETTVEPAGAEPPAMSEPASEEEPSRGTEPRDAQSQAVPEPTAAESTSAAPTAAEPTAERPPVSGMVPSGGDESYGESTTAQSPATMVDRLAATQEPAAQASSPDEEPGPIEAPAASEPDTGEPDPGQVVTEDGAAAPTGPSAFRETAVSEHGAGPAEAPAEATVAPDEPSSGATPPRGAGEPLAERPASSEVSAAAAKPDESSAAPSPGVSGPSPVTSAVGAARAPSAAGASQAIPTVPRPASAAHAAVAASAQTPFQPSAPQWKIQPLPGDPPLTLYRDKRMVMLPAGTEVDRYGEPTGNVTYAARTPYQNRSLPADWINFPYHVYRLQQPLEALTGLAVPWFEQPGGGTAFVLPRSIADLVADGSLVEIDESVRSPSA